MKEVTQETAIVPSPKTTAEAIPESTARLVEKSFGDNTMRNFGPNKGWHFIFCIEFFKISAVENQTKL